MHAHVPEIRGFRPSDSMKFHQGHTRALKVGVKVGKAGQACQYGPPFLRAGCFPHQSDQVISDNSSAGTLG